MVLAKRHAVFCVILITGCSCSQTPITEERIKWTEEYLERIIRANVDAEQDFSGYLVRGLRRALQRVRKRDSLATPYLATAIIDVEPPAMYLWFLDAHLQTTGLALELGNKEHIMPMCFYWAKYSDSEKQQDIRGMPIFACTYRVLITLKRNSNDRPHADPRGTTVYVPLDFVRKGLRVRLLYGDGSKSNAVQAYVGAKIREMHGAHSN